MKRNQTRSWLIAQLVIDVPLVAGYVAESLMVRTLYLHTYLLVVLVLFAVNVGALWVMLSRSNRRSEKALTVSLAVITVVPVFWFFLNFGNAIFSW